MTGTVLIAGASGLVGTAAAIEFADAGWNVIALSRRVYRNCLKDAVAGILRWI